jgi:tetratricopeptide (TPR) repeat protein
MSACSPRNEPSSDGVDFSALESEVRELTTRHAVSEALELITREGGKLVSPRGEAERRVRIEEARLLLLVSRPADAVRTLEILDSRERHDPNVDVLLVSALAEAGEPRRALEVAARLDASRAAATVLARARAHLGAGESDIALALLAARLSVDPWDMEAYLLFGEALSARAEPRANSFLGRYRADEPARKAIQTALRFEFDGDEASSRVARGRIELDRGRYFEAMMLYNAALGIDRRRGAALLALATISIRVGRPGDAIRVLGSLPENPEVLLLLGDAHRTEGDFARAQSAYERAERAGRGSATETEARDRLEALRADSGGDESDSARHERAILARMSGRPLSSCGEELCALIDARVDRGDVEEAARLALFAAQVAPHSRAAWSRVAKLHEGDRHLFSRIWAGLRSGSSAQRAEADRELATLGVPIDRYRAELEAILPRGTEPNPTPLGSSPAR